MKPGDELQNIGARPLWLLALIPLLGVIWAGWYIAKHWG